MVKVTKNNKNPKKLKKISNGVEKVVKQKTLLKTKKNAAGDLKKKLVKRIKESTDLKSNVQKSITPKVKKIEKKKNLTEIRQINTPDKKEDNARKVPKIKVKKSIAKKHEEIKSKKENEDLQANEACSTETKFDAASFDEELFKRIVSLENIVKICKALKKVVQGEVAVKKTSIFSDYRYFLNVASFKIPNCPKRMVKLNLKHSMVDQKEDDIVLFVPDLQRGAKVDYEPTIQHYESLLEECGVVAKLKIIPFNQLRNECATFEEKRKLANTYDYFLCDGRIVGHVVGFCGKTFQKPRTTIHAVHLNDPKKYKNNIEKALKRTVYKQLSKGDIISIPVGNHRFTINQLSENINFVIDQLNTVFPGSYPNIRNMHVKIDIKGTSALPIFISLAAAPAETPNVIGPRERRILKLKKQANEVLSKFSLSKTGDFVKLNKAQVERKQNIRDARAVLLAKKSESNDSIPPPAKKNKGSTSYVQKAESEEDNGEESNEDNAEDINDVSSEEDYSENKSENSDEEE